VAFPLFRVELPASLSAEESAELSARLAALAQSGLPLESGLYALADDVAQPKLASVLRNLASRLEEGQKLETAIAAQGSRLPAHLRGLIVAGVRSGRLPLVLDQFAALTRRGQDVRRRVLLTLAYPAILLGIMAALLIFCYYGLSSQFATVFKDFNCKLPELTVFFFQYSGTVAWTMLGLTIAAIAIPLAAMFVPVGAWLGRTTSWIPIVGKIARDDCQAQFSHLLALLLEEEVPLPEALRLTAAALQDTMLARQSAVAATAVESGLPLDQALLQARFPDSLAVLAAWGQQKNSLTQSLRAAAEAFEARTNSQSALLNVLVPPLMYMAIITFAGITVLALMMPLMSLISNLSGGGSSGQSGPNADAWIGLSMVASVLAFLLGALVLMRIRWLTGPAPGDRKTAYLTAIRTFAWGLMVVGFVVGTCLVLPGLAIILFATLAIIVAAAYGKQVATQQYAMLALVGAAAEQSMPLETAFAAFGRERGGWMRQRAAEIAYRLHNGAALPDALNDVPGVLPPEAVPLVCVGYRIGSLAPAIDSALAVRNLFQPAWQSIIPKLLYVCILPPFAMAIIAFLCLKIVPQYQKIFVDFNTRLPEITNDIFYVCGWPPLGLLAVVASLLLITVAVYGSLRYVGSIRWDLPGMAWLMRRQHIAAVLDAVALSTQQQRPLGEALSTLALSYQQPSIRRRLAAVCEALRSGADDLQCLYRHGLLGKTDLALLQAARQNNNLAWAAGEMADSNRRRFIYRTNAVLQVIFPLVVIGYGLVVAATAAAMFLPLAELIQRLAPQ
jgi:type II secretory pathway component PulF